ncbi:MAG: membrane or secreted protein [Lacipirellulaceae bacterium]
MLRPAHRLPLALVAPCVCLALAAGCGGTVKMPSLFHPGNASTQRYNAIVHDPYPLNDVGPDVVGGRPLGYQNPVPEVVRGRLFDPPATRVPPR